MTYKLLIVKNRYTKRLSLSKYLDWFKKNTPITIETEEIKTDFDVESQKVSNGTFSGVICKNTILEKLKTVVDENKYHVVVFIYGNDLDGIRVSCCNGVGRKDFLYPNTDVIQLAKVNDSGKTLNHEIFHSFFARLSRNGIIIEDCMDTYMNDSDLTVDDNINTNREMALKKLQPYWSQICELEDSYITKVIKWLRSLGII